MQRTLVCVLLLCLATPAWTQTKPVLASNFRSFIHREIFNSGFSVSNQTTWFALDTTTYQVWTEYYDPVFNKNFSQVENCLTGGLVWVYSFFDNLVCFNLTNPPQQSADSCISSYLQTYLLYSYYPSANSYGGTTVINGVTVQQWTYTNAAYNTATYYISENGQMVRIHIVEGTQTVIDNLSDYASPAPAGTFLPPSPVQCAAASAELEPKKPFVQRSEDLLLQRRMNDPEALEELQTKLKKSTWTAGPSVWPHPNATLAEVADRLNTKMPFGTSNYAFIRGKVTNSNFTLPKDVPASFDARQQWQGCPSISLVRNQGSCGSCWAFGATEAFQDRYCIATGNNGNNPIFSPQYLVDCDMTNTGCNGGFVDNVMIALKQGNLGVVTDTCDPYQYCTFEPNSNCSRVSAKSEGFGSLGVCPSTCQNAEQFNKYYVSEAYASGSWENIAAIMEDIYAHGPIEVAFYVYSDFMSYRSGIYQRTANSYLMGGHAVKLIGWGEENGVPYWLLTNSWSPQWGENGYFRFLRGTNEVGIETVPAAGKPAGVQRK